MPKARHLFLVLLVSAWGVGLNGAALAGSFRVAVAANFAEAAGLIICLVLVVVG